MIGPLQSLSCSRWTHERSERSVPAPGGRTRDRRAGSAARRRLRHARRRTPLAQTSTGCPPWLHRVTGARGLDALAATYTFVRGAAVAPLAWTCRHRSLGAVAVATVLFGGSAATAIDRAGRRPGGRGARRPLRPRSADACLRPHVRRGGSPCPWQRAHFRPVLGRGAQDRRCLLLRVIPASAIQHSSSPSHSRSRCAPLSRMSRRDSASDRTRAAFVAWLPAPTMVLRSFSGEATSSRACAHVPETRTERRFSRADRRVPPPLKEQARRQQRRPRQVPASTRTQHPALGCFRDLTPSPPCAGASETRRSVDAGLPSSRGDRT